ncbi:MAG: SpoIID/LytB domain-containing protein [Actinobacteria bacterium]|nr:SpoIID/LytB domain-containing protein [Actinomycetota bacterium]
MTKYTPTIVLIFWLVLIGSAPGLAADEYTFEGYGYGHGIGMCQWGAKGRADSGQTYQQILSRYFQGTQVTSNYSVPSRVRVRLFGSSNLSRAYIEGGGSTTFNFIKTDGSYVYKGAIGKWAIVSTSTGLLRLIKPDGTIGADNLTGPIIATNTLGSLVVYNASGSRYHAYEGSIYIYPNSSASFYLVNYVQFEPYYLYGLGEVPSSWPYQALYAQAIAARSYAIRNMKPQDKFDLYDSVASQVYVGVDKINEVSNGTNWGARWKKAVDDTASKVITYNGAVISAYYFSSCGGHTENVELAWPNASPQPYLKGVSDIDSSGKAFCQQSGNSSFSWSKTISKADFESKLGIPNIANLRVTKMGVSPRISQLEIVQSNGIKTSMQGNTFRLKLGLKSTWISNMGGTFPDVPLDYWAFTQIEDLAKRGVITGYTDGKFKPEVAVTRGQFSKMLCIALGIPTGSASSFNDTPGHWAEPYIAALVNQEIIRGYPDGTFRPDRSITRAEISAIISRAMGLSPGSSPASFPDIADHWAKSDIEIMASNGLVNGYADGYFKPDLNAKRCEVAVIIYRMFGFVQ